jgi:hypothetical protein
VIRRLLVAIGATVIVAMGLMVTACKPSSLSGTFAFVDDEGFTSIYDLSMGKVIWRSEFTSTECSQPSWSSKGDYLVHEYIDESGARYVRILDVTDMSSRSVCLGNQHLWNDRPLNWEWSPSGRYVAFFFSDYPVIEASILSIDDAKIVCTTCTSSKLIWDQNEEKICHSFCQKDVAVSGSCDELIVVNLKTGDCNCVFKGDIGQSIRPVAWTDDGAVIFRSTNRSEILVMDTSGKEYPNRDECQKYYIPASLSAERPSQLLHLNMKVGGWSKSSEGVWLVSRAVEGSPYEISLFLPGDEKGLQVVSGTAPVWRPL